MAHGTRVDADSCDVLVVDDDGPTVELLLAYLASRHVNARGITSSKDYLRDVRAANPQLVLLDVALPGVSGYRLCAEIKKTKETKDVRVILFTAKPPADVIANVDACNADGYLLKPFTLSGIDDAVGIASHTSTF